MVTRTLEPTITFSPPLIATNRLVPTNQLVTADELLAISQRDDARFELLQGDLIMMSPAGSKHGNLAMKIGARIQVYVEDQGQGYVFAAETGFFIETDPDTVRAPDVGYIRQERLPAEGLPDRYFPGAPDLAVEVISPSDSASDVQAKVRDWLSHGTQLVWVVEPKSETAMVYRGDGRVDLLLKGDHLDGEDVLPGFSYALDRLFA